MGLSEILIKIDDIKAKLDAAPDFTEGELGRFREQFMVEYTYDSNAIEGNTLTLEETALVLLEGLTINKKPLRCHLEAIGHRDAFEYVVELAKKQEHLTEKMIKDIHALVLMDRPRDKGKYRDVSVSIFGALDTPPSPMQVPARMESLLKKNSEDGRHPIIKIADFHIKFEQIHPFVDGNGRAGRLIMNLELIKAGYAPVNIKFKDRDLYMSCFKDAVTKGNSLKFVEMLAKYELDELENTYFLSQEKLRVIEYKRANGLLCQPPAGS